MNKRKPKPKPEGDTKVPRMDEDSDQGQLMVDETVDNQPGSEDKVIKEYNQLVNIVEELGFPTLENFPVEPLTTVTTEIVKATMQVN